MLSLLTLRNLLNTMLTLASGATALGSVIEAAVDSRDTHALKSA